MRLEGEYDLKFPCNDTIPNPNAIKNVGGGGGGLGLDDLFLGIPGCFDWVRA